MRLHLVPPLVLPMQRTLRTGFFAAFLLDGLLPAAFLLPAFFAFLGMSTLLLY